MPSKKMYNCTECGFAAKSAGGLASHKRSHNSTPEPVNLILATKSQGGVCTSCNTLPLGSVELVSLLLVLVFSLTAVLLTSVYALDAQNHYISQLESQLN